MATSKASTSGLTGSKSKDASAGTTKIPALPDTPTIGSASTVNGAASISFTPANRGGATTNFQAISTPGSVTKNSTTSPINYDALDLTVGTTYTFTVKGVNSSGNSDLSEATNSFTQPGYTLSQTFNSSGQYTTPAGKNLLGIKLVGAGAGGGGGGWAPGGVANAGGGGGGAGAGIIEEISTSPGTVYTVTVASGGPGGVGHDGNNGYQGDDGSGSGTTSFGNIITANGSNGGVKGYSGSGGGNGGNFSYNTGTLRSSTNGKQGGSTSGSGQNTSALTTPNAQVGTYSVSGGGGGGGGGTSGGGGAAGGTFNGGSGGNAANSSGGPGGGGSGNLGGGGGGGGSGHWGGNENYLNAAGGGSGGSGQVIVFVK
jgi:hypothetical protein